MKKQPKEKKLFGVVIEDELVRRRVNLSLKTLSAKSVSGVDIDGDPFLVFRRVFEHNLRDDAHHHVQPGKIDRTRSHLNKILLGPSTVVLSEQLARDTFESMALETSRRGCIMGFEAVCFPGTFPEPLILYQWTNEWLAGKIGPILRSDQHNDQRADHAHSILIPIMNGKLAGGALSSGDHRFGLLHDEFLDAASKEFGSIVLKGHERNGLWSGFKAKNRTGKSATGKSGAGAGGTGKFPTGNWGGSTHYAGKSPTGKSGPKSHFPYLRCFEEKPSVTTFNNLGVEAVSGSVPWNAPTAVPWRIPQPIPGAVIAIDSVAREALARVTAELARVRVEAIRDREALAEAEAEVAAACKQRAAFLLARELAEVAALAALDRTEEAGSTQTDAFERSLAQIDRDHDAACRASTIAAKAMQDAQERAAGSLSNDQRRIESKAHAPNMNTSPADIQPVQVARVPRPSRSHEQAVRAARMVSCGQRNFAELPPHMVGKGFLSITDLMGMRIPGWNRAEKLEAALELLVQQGSAEFHDPYLSPGHGRRYKLVIDVAPAPFDAALAAQLAAEDTEMLQILAGRGWRTTTSIVKLGRAGWTSSTKVNGSLRRLIAAGEVERRKAAGHQNHMVDEYRIADHMPISSASERMENVP